MSMYENPFQQTVIKESDKIINLFNEIVNNVNNITINMQGNYKLSILHNYLFMVYDVEYLEQIINSIELNMKNVMVRKRNNKFIGIHNDVSIKTSIIFSIIYASKNIPSFNNSIFKKFSDTVFSDCYENLVCSLDLYVGEVSSRNTNIKVLDNFYNYLFENKDHFELILHSDRELLYILLINCYNNISPYYYYKIMKKLDFNEEFIECIHNKVNKKEVNNLEFKQFFNLE